MRRSAMKNRDAIHRRCGELLEDYRRLNPDRFRQGGRGDFAGTDEEWRRMREESARAVLGWMGRCALLLDAAFPAGAAFVKAAERFLLDEFPAMHGARMRELLEALKSELEAGVFGELKRGGASASAGTAADCAQIGAVAQEGLPPL